MSIDMIKNILLIFCLIGMIFCLIGIAVNVFFLIKNNNAYKNHIIIVEAIYEYCIEKNVDFALFYNMYMEDYDDTLNRFWDWGYTRILPPEQFELIKPYIKE